jgi:hypothetical protein
VAEFLFTWFTLHERGCQFLIYMLSAPCLFFERNGGRGLTWRLRLFRLGPGSHSRQLCPLPEPGAGCPSLSHLSSNVHSTLIMASDVVSLSIICIPRTMWPLSTHDAL